MTQPHCCARKETQVTRAASDLAAVARKASIQQHRLDYWGPRIERAKRALADAKASQVDHEADHAA